MSDNEIMKQWKKSSIVIGSPTNILAALTSLHGAWLLLPLERFILWSRFPTMPLSV